MVGVVVVGIVVHVVLLGGPTGPRGRPRGIKEPRGGPPGAAAGLRAGGDLSDAIWSLLESLLGFGPAGGIVLEPPGATFGPEVGGDQFGAMWRLLEPLLGFGPAKTRLVQLGCDEGGNGVELGAQNVPKCGSEIADSRDVWHLRGKVAALAKQM